jgi:predicted ATPase
MITRFRLENFKAHRDTDLALRQFTLLVGDNSSGKTSVLEALRLPGQLLDHAKHGGHPAYSELLRWGSREMGLTFWGQRLAQSWTTSIGLDVIDDEPLMDVNSLDTSGREYSDMQPASHLAPLVSALRTSVGLLGPTGFYRFRADQIAASAYPFFRSRPDQGTTGSQSQQAETPVAEDGGLTAVVLAALRLTEDAAFDRISQGMRRLVPSLRRIGFTPADFRPPTNRNPEVSSKLYFDFQGAQYVPAHHASQGTLVALALLTVLHGHNRPSVILLDDFDHSLHPRAQMELVRMIKELLALDEFKDTQIVATTHSPFVLDEVSPSEVIAFALRDDGTVAAKPLSEHPDAPRVNGSLKAGELWTLDAERDWVR